MTEQVDRRVRVTYLAKLIKRKRQLDELTLHDVSSRTGVSIATLSRLERQSKFEQLDQNLITPDTRTVIALARWLAVPLDELFESEVNATADEDVNLPLLVDTHLRANRKLNPDDAEFISRVFREMYDKYVNQTTDDTTVSEESRSGEE